MNKINFTAKKKISRLNNEHRPTLVLKKIHYEVAWFVALRDFFRASHDGDVTLFRSDDVQSIYIFIIVIVSSGLIVRLYNGKYCKLYLVKLLFLAICLNLTLFVNLINCVYDVTIMTFNWQLSKGEYSIWNLNKFFCYKITPTHGYNPVHSPDGII